MLDEGDSPDPHGHSDRAGLGREIESRNTAFIARTYCLRGSPLPHPGGSDTA